MAIIIYDCGAECLNERYTILSTKKPLYRFTHGLMYNAIVSNSLGMIAHIDCGKGAYNGKRVAFDELPLEVQRRCKEFMLQAGDYRFYGSRLTKGGAVMDALKYHGLQAALVVASGLDCGLFYQDIGPGSRVEFWTNNEYRKWTRRIYQTILS